MLTKKEKEKLNEYIYNLLNTTLCESLWEADDNEDDADSTDNDEKEDAKLAHKRESVLKWLDSAQELHSVLSYRLWPERSISDDSKRSLFSKKYRGEDADGKHYEFTPHEITTLYNMKGDYIEDIS